MGQIAIIGNQAMPFGMYQAIWQVVAGGNWFHAPWVMPQGVASQLYGVFTIPADYTGTPRAVPHWTTGVTSGTIRLHFGYRAVAGGDAETLNQGTSQESVIVNPAPPSAAHRLINGAISLTAGNFAPGDLVEFFFERRGHEDSLFADAYLHHLVFEYS